MGAAKQQIVAFGKSGRSDRPDSAGIIVFEATHALLVIRGAARDDAASPPLLVPPRSSFPVLTLPLR
jgi:hypothetical protein